VLLLEFAHIGFDVIVDFEAVGFQMADPFFAATAIGVAVNLDRDQVGGLGSGRPDAGGFAWGISSRIAAKKMHSDHFSQHRGRRLFRSNTADAKSFVARGFIGTPHRPVRLRSSRRFYGAASQPNGGKPPRHNEP
jgi:hypothetical protein